MRILRTGNNNTKRLAYTELVRPIPVYGAVYWDRYWSMERCVGTDTGVWSGVLGPILEYEPVCWDRYWSIERCVGTDTEGQVSALNRVQKRAAKFANNTNESCWETLAQRRLIARIWAIFKAYTGERAWKGIENKLLKPCCTSRDGPNRKIRTRKQKTDVGKYPFVNRTIKSWNQLPAGLLASFPSKPTHLERG